MGAAFCVKNNNKMEEYYYIGVDNGVSGSIAVVDSRGRMIFYGPTPVEPRQTYTKSTDSIRRLMPHKFAEILRPYVGNAVLVLERPATGPHMGWKAIQSSVRCDEAQNVVMEVLGIKFEYVDSKTWQKVMLPPPKSVPRASKGATPAEKKALDARRKDVKKQTKISSLEIGRRLFPKQDFGNTKASDADAALIAEWARLNKR